MFELGLDQAHGLKQMFMPISNGRINVIGVCPDRDIAAAAIAIGNALTERGFDVQWQDADGLLPENQIETDPCDGAQIVVAAWRDVSNALADQTIADHSVFAANPHPEQLTELYKAMKSASNNAEHYVEQPPFTVVWSGHAPQDRRLQQVCEANLSETVERFLLREVEYVNAGSGDHSGVQSNNAIAHQPQIESSQASHGFIERLSTQLLSRLGHLGQLNAAALN